MARNPEMMYAEEMDPELRRKRLFQARYNAERDANVAQNLQQKELSAQNPLVDNLGTVIRGGTYNSPPFALRPSPLVGPPTPLRTGSSPLPKPPTRPSGTVGEVPFDRGPKDPTQLNEWVSRQLGESPKSPVPSGPEPVAAPTTQRIPGGTPAAHPPRERTATSDMDNFGNIPTGMNARPADPTLLAMNDTEQGRRDLAMLRKQRNLTDAALMGQNNRYSKFYNPGMSGDQRAELILAKEGMNQELATAQRAANPPRYETDPNSERAIRGRESLAGNLDKILMDEARATQLPGGQPGPVDTTAVDQRVGAFRDSIAPKAKSPEQMLAEETAQNRQQQAVVQANTDQGARDKTRQYQTEYNDAMRTSSLTRAKTEGTIAKAEGTTAEAAANRAAAESEIAAAAIPNEVARARAMEQRGNSPTYAPAVSRVAEGIKSLSGQAIRPTGMVEARRVLNEGIATLNAMPPDLQRVAAAEILSNLRAENLDLPKDAYQDAWFKWLINGAGFLNTPTDRQTSAVQSQINQTLQILKDKAAKSGVNPTMFQPGAAG